MFKTQKFLVSFTSPTKPQQLGLVSLKARLRAPLVWKGPWIQREHPNYETNSTSISTRMQNCTTHQYQHIELHSKKQCRIQLRKIRVLQYHSTPNSRNVAPVGLVALPKIQLFWQTTTPSRNVDLPFFKTDGSSASLRPKYKRLPKHHFPAGLLLLLSLSAVRPYCALLVVVPCGRGHWCYDLLSIAVSIRGKSPTRNSSSRY
jgi:hypothetical protein